MEGGTAQQSAVCERCTLAAGEGRWCEGCGLDLRPDEPTLPTPEALEAARRSVLWEGQATDEERERWAAPREAPPPETTVGPARPSGLVPSAEALDSYRSPRLFGLVAGRWMAFAVVAALAAGAEDVYALSLLSDTEVNAAKIVALADLEVALNVAQLGISLIAVILFLLWFRRVYRNLPGLGIERPRHSRGWAVGAWFVPFLCLWRPKQIANDAWRSGQTDYEDESTSFEARPVSGLLHWWWATWIGAEVLGRASFTSFRNAETIPEIRSAVLVDIAWSVTYVVAGALAVLVIRQVSARQEARVAQLREEHAKPAAS